MLGNVLISGDYCFHRFYDRASHLELGKSRLNFDSNPPPPCLMLVFYTHQITYFVCENHRKTSRKKAFMAVIGERMASQTKASKIEKLTALPGVGAATAKKLVDAKLDSVSKVAAAGASKLVKAGIKAAIAKKIVSAAKGADKASSTTKAVASKAKAAAKQAPAKAKATASKAKAAAKQAASSAKNLAKSDKPKTDKSSTAKSKKIGPSPKTPLSKMAWFKNLKK